jgi:hypothetical protein
MGQAEQVGNNDVIGCGAKQEGAGVQRSHQRSLLDHYSSWKDHREAIVGTTIDILEKVETCWMAGNTQRSESDNKSKIRLLYRGQDIETVGEP